MPKFIEQIIENHFWNEIYFEIPDFSLGSDEEEIRIEDAYVPDNIDTI